MPTIEVETTCSPAEIAVEVEAAMSFALLALTSGPLRPQMPPDTVLDYLRCAVAKAPGAIDQFTAERMATAWRALKGKSAYSEDHACALNVLFQSLSAAAQLLEEHSKSKQDADGVIDRWHSHIDTKRLYTAQGEIVMEALAIELFAAKQQRAGKKKGRPLTMNEREENRILAAWQTGSFRNFADCANALGGVKARDVALVLDRHRKRKQRDRRAC